MNIWNTSHAYVKHSAKLPSCSFKESNGAICQNKFLITRAELPVAPLVHLSANVFRTRSCCFISDSYEGPVIYPCVLSPLRHISSLCFCASSLCLSIRHSHTSSPTHNGNSEPSVLQQLGHPLLSHFLPTSPTSFSLHLSAPSCEWKGTWMGPTFLTDDTDNIKLPMSNLPAAPMPQLN